MPWLSATTVVDRGCVEPLSDALMEAGALSVDVSDQTQIPATPYWRIDVIEAHERKAGREAA